MDRYRAKGRKTPGVERVCIVGWSFGFGFQAWSGVQVEWRNSDAFGLGHVDAEPYLSIRLDQLPINIVIRSLFDLVSFSDVLTFDAVHKFSWNAVFCQACRFLTACREVFVDFDAFLSCVRDGHLDEPSVLPLLNILGIWCNEGGWDTTEADDVTNWLKARQLRGAGVGTLVVCFPKSELETEEKAWLESVARWVEIVHLCPYAEPV